jgi:ABC-type multidrug transport system fused ATPase/permease subunit
VADLDLKIRIGAEVKAIQDALGRVTDDLNALTNTARKSGAGAARGLDAVDDAADDARGAVSGLNREMGRTGGIGQVEGKQAARGFSGVSSAVESAKRQLLGLVTAYAGFSTASGLVRLADEASLVNSRLRLVTSSTEEYTSAQRGLFAVAQRTRASLSETVDLYSRIARSTRDLALSQEDALGVTEAINQAVSQNVTALLASVLSLVGIIAAMFWLNHWLALTTLVVWVRVVPKPPCAFTEVAAVPANVSVEFVTPSSALAEFA